MQLIVLSACFLHNHEQMANCNTCAKHIPLQGKREKGSYFLLLILGIWDIEIVISGFKPLLVLSYHHVLSIWFSVLRPVLNLLDTFVRFVVQTASSVRGVWRQLSSLQSNVTVFHIIVFLLHLIFFSQVPTKKAKLGESRLQIMDDEDTLDKYQVRNPWLSSVMKALKSFLSAVKINIFKTHSQCAVLLHLSRN